MGWKNVKEAYRIEHQVRVTSDGICIGSPYIPEIIVVRMDGTITKRYESLGNADLLRYQQEMEADPEKLRRLIAEPDRFSADLVVYTYKGGEILEKRCEQYGWPNITHDGQMMYENTHSPNLAEVVQWAKRNADAGIELCQRRIAELREDIASREAVLAGIVQERAALEAAYPA